MPLSAKTNPIFTLALNAISEYKGAKLNDFRDLGERDKNFM